MNLDLCDDLIEIFSQTIQVCSSKVDLKFDWTNEQNLEVLIHFLIYESNVWKSSD